MSIFRIRAADQNDFPGMAKVRVDTWRATYKGIMPDEFLEDLSYQQISERWKKTYWEDRDPNVAVFVAENGQQEIVGIVICGPEQSHDPIYHGEIYVLYVLPGYQDQGIGRELVAACVHYLIQQLRVETMLIWVVAENPYRKFYEALDGKIVREKVQQIAGRMISEVGYGWEEIHNLAIPRTARSAVRPHLAGASMSLPGRKFTAADLVPGRTYTVITAFQDYDGIVHPIGERWRFMEKNFLPYEDGLTLLVERNGQNMSFRLQWREETQAQIIDDFSDFVEEM